MADNLYIGIMSGTSIDGIDASLCEITKDSFSCIKSTSIDWDSHTKDELHKLCHSSTDEIVKSSLAANAIAKHEALIVNKILKSEGLTSEDIVAVGAHGQTVRHYPNKGFSVQLDNGPLLAHLTNIDAIVNFRAADIASCGEGAPLTPAFHKLILSSKEETRYILNLGGISNITVLDDSGEIVTGFDCGPANTLLDLTCRCLLNIKFDVDAKIASRGKVLDKVLEKLLSHPYLKEDFPKSTGRETFNLDTIDEYLKACHKEDINVEDLLYTLSLYTVLCVKKAIEDINKRFTLNKKASLILCGGGALNPLLKSLFEKELSLLSIKVYSSDKFKLDPCFIESQAFAYFAYLCTNGIALDMSAFTKAKSPSILGCICPSINGYFARSKRHG